MPLSGVSDMCDGDPQVDMFTPQELFLLRLSVEKVRSSVYELLDKLEFLTTGDLHETLPLPEGDRGDAEDAGDDLPF
jgi:hypothetical protein